MKNILIVTPGGMPVPSVKGGAVQNLVELLIEENQTDIDNKITIVSPYDEKAEKVSNIKYANCNFEFIKIPILYEKIDLLVYNFAKYILRRKHLIPFRNNFKYLYFAIRTSKILKKNNYDRVVFENNVRNFWALRLHSNVKKYRDKYYFHIHNIPRGNAGNKKVIKKCKKFLCVSKYLSDEIESPNNKIGPTDKKKTYILKNCIDLNKFNNNLDDKKIQDIRKKYKIKKDDIVILFAGRLDAQKGVLETIQAVKQINNTKIKLLIVGSCFYEMKVQSSFQKVLIDEAKTIEDRIIFTGYVQYEDMPYMYKIAYASVLPSLSIEAAGLTIIESMACGTPVITTNIGGIPEYTNNSCSYILDVNNKIIENIKKSILELVENPNKRNYLSKKSINHVKEYNAKKYYVNFLKSIDIKK